MTKRFSQTILVLVAVSLLGAGTALAKGPGNAGGEGFGAGNQQTEDGQKGSPAQRMARISERLGLSEEQEVELLELFHQHEQGRADMHDAIMLQFGGEICALRAAQQEAFLAILTPEQLALHEEMQANREARGGARRGNGKLECEAG